MHKPRLILIVGPAEAGKSKLIEALLLKIRPKGILITWANDILAPSSIIIKSPDIDDNLHTQLAGYLSCLRPGEWFIIDDMDTILNVQISGTNPFMQIYNQYRNRGITGVLSAKYITRIPLFFRENAKDIIYRPPQDPKLQSWFLETGKPINPLPIYHFHHVCGEKQQIINRNTIKLITGSDT